MKVVLFGTALLACAIPAVGQVDSTLQPSSPIPGNCEAALFSNRVPSAVVVITVPTPGMPAGDVVGSASSLGPRANVAHGYAGSFSRPSPSAPGVVSGVGTVSGIGSIGTGGIGSIGTGGIGGMGTSGVGSIGMGSIGSMGTSGLGPPPSLASPSSPFLAPPIQSPPAVGVPSVRSNAITQPLPGTRRVPFFCP